MKLTVKSTVGLKLPSGLNKAGKPWEEKIYFDDEIPGFGLRVREGGSRNYIFQYKIGAKQRRVALGAVSAIDFGKARDTAKNLYAKVRLGHDPAGEKADTRAKAHQTFKAIADGFLDIKRKELRPRSYADVTRHILVHAKPLHALRLDRIKPEDIAALLSAVEKNSGAVTRNRVRTSLSTFFAWAISEGNVSANPVIGTRRAKEASRDRVLSPAELRLIWQALPDDQFGAIMKLLALTGQRAGEIAGLCWSEIYDDRIELPGERTKNHRAHNLPLAPMAKAIIKAQPRRTLGNGEPRDLIFGAGKGPFSGWSKQKPSSTPQSRKPPARRSRTGRHTICAEALPLIAQKWG